MSMESCWPVPYIIDPMHFEVDAVVAFCVSVLLAVAVSAEAQAFAATSLGDARPSPKDRFHFNAFLHLGVLGTICYLVGGFGWPRTMEIDPGKFRDPRLYLVLARAAGPIANLLLASIGGSIAMLMNILELDPRVFFMVIGVNITTAVYNLIPLPPLAAGILVQELIPEDHATLRSLLAQAGPFLIIALALLERITPGGIVSPYLNPLVAAIFNYLKG